jgi:hypothetical protein
MNENKMYLSMQHSVSEIFFHQLLCFFLHILEANVESVMFQNFKLPVQQIIHQRAKQKINWTFQIDLRKKSDPNGKQKKSDENSSNKQMFPQKSGFWKTTLFRPEKFYRLKKNI